MKRVLFTFAALAAVTMSAPALADEAMAKAKNCMACHATDKKLVGPAYKDVAKKYAGDAKALDLLVTHIQKGSSASGVPCRCLPTPTSTPTRPRSWPSGCCR